MPEVIESLIDELSAASTSEDVYHVLDRRLGELGFERFAYHVLISSEGARKPMYLGTYPDAWARHYIANDYVNVDPVMPQATRGILPFNWADLYKSLAQKSRQRKVIDEAGDFGLPNGIIVPVHGPGKGVATLNVAAQIPGREFNELWRRHRHELHLIAMYSHEAIARLASQGKSEAQPHLAPRERECLLWTARGKTAWEISTILNISQETVVHYLKSASSKLGVHNKTHAVVKAILMGLVVP